MTTEVNAAKDSKLVLWGAVDKAVGKQLLIYEELQQEPILKKEFEHIYPVHIMLVRTAEASVEWDIELPREMALALSAHFRQWFGNLTTQATQLRGTLDGTPKEVRDAKLEFISAQYALKKVTEKLATALYLSTRQPCKNCGEFVYQSIEDSWVHEDIEKSASCSGLKI